MTGDETGSRHTALILLALSDGNYLGHGCPAALVQFNRRPVLLDCLDVVLHDVGLQEVALVVPEGSTSYFDEVINHRDWPTVRIVPVAGGRREALREGLAVTSKSSQVLVHDAERALAPPKLFEAVLVALRDGADVAVPGLEVTDSVKSCTRDASNEDVLNNVKRDTVRALQTPVGFRREVLARVLDEAPTGVQGASQGFCEVRAAGAITQAVTVVEGNFLASAIHGPIDLWRAQIIMGLARKARTAHLSPDLLRRGV